MVVRSHYVHLDSDYVQWIHNIKERFRSAQIKAAVKVNSEQLLFNWQLGRDLVTRKVEEKWGTGIVEQLSLDLKNEFPDIRGFSTTNLWYMKKWYKFYSDGDKGKTPTTYWRNRSKNFNKSAQNRANWKNYG